MIGIWSLNSQQIRCFLWDPKLISAHTTILSPVNRVILLEISLCIICILTHRIYKDVPAHKGFPNKILYVFLSSPVRTTCHIDFILCLTFGSAYRLNHIIFPSHQVFHLPFYPKYPSHWPHLSLNPYSTLTVSNHDTGIFNISPFNGVGDLHIHKGFF
jgi:hypothetical protein